MPSLFLHLFVIFFASVFAQIGVRENLKAKGGAFKINFAYIISFLLIVVFIASREYVGRDWDGYYRIFTAVNQQDFKFGESREIGFLILVNLLNRIGFEFQSFISITAFITIFLFFRAFKRFYYLLPVAIIFFFIGIEYSMVINTIRQGISIFCLLNALMYINEDNKHPIRNYLLFIFLGSLFHYSVILFVPFYWIARWNVKPWALFICCIVVFVFCYFFLMNIFIDFMAIIPKYDVYSDSVYVYASDSSFGLGAILLLFLRVLPLFYMEPITNDSPELKKYFILYAIGISIYYSFYKFLLITRFTFYLQFCDLFIFSSLIIYLWRSRKALNKVVAMGYLGLSVFNFIYLFEDFLRDQLASNNFSIMFMKFHYML